MLQCPLLNTIIMEIKRNAIQDQVKILPHFCYNGHYQEQKKQQMLTRMWGEKEFSFTVGEILN
jgi:hypothetical protein